MPVRFRCSGCRSRLSIARRKVGTDVVCPTCQAVVTVPTLAAVADELTEPLTVATLAKRRSKKVSAGPPKPTPTSSVPPPANLDDLPLFERDDFARLLEPAVTEAKTEPKPEPPPADPVVPAVPADGILILRSTATMLVMAVVALLGLAFAAGFLVGSR